MLFFFGFGAGGEDGFEGIGVEAGVIDFGGEGHGSWGEVLDLFEFEVELAGFGGEVGHVGFSAAGVGGDKIWNQLLAASVGAFLSIILQFFEQGVERFELLKVGLAH